METVFHVRMNTQQITGNLWQPGFGSRPDCWLPKKTPGTFRTGSVCQGPLHGYLWRRKAWPITNTTVKSFTVQHVHTDVTIPVRHNFDTVCVVNIGHFGLWHIRGLKHLQYTWIEMPHCLKNIEMTAMSNSSLKMHHVAANLAVIDNVETDLRVRPKLRRCETKCRC